MDVLARRLIARYTESDAPLEEVHADMTARLLRASECDGFELVRGEVRAGLDAALRDQFPDLLEAGPSAIDRALETFTASPAFAALRRQCRSVLKRQQRRTIELMRRAAAVPAVRGSLPVAASSHDSGGSSGDAHQKKTNKKRTKKKKKSIFNTIYNRPFPPVLGRAAPSHDDVSSQGGASTFRALLGGTHGDMVPRSRPGTFNTSGSESDFSAITLSSMPAIEEIKPMAKLLLASSQSTKREALHNLCVVQPGDLLTSQHWLLVKEAFLDCLNSSDEQLSRDALLVHLHLHRAAEPSAQTAQVILNVLKHFDFVFGDAVVGAALLPLKARLLSYLQNELPRYWINFPDGIMREIMDFSARLFVEFGPPSALLARVDPCATWFELWTAHGHARALLAEAMGTRSRRIAAQMRSTCEAFRVVLDTGVASKTEWVHHIYAFSVASRVVELGMLTPEEDGASGGIDAQWFASLAAELLLEMTAVFTSLREPSFAAHRRMALVLAQAVARGLALGALPEQLRETFFSVVGRILREETTRALASRRPSTPLVADVRSRAARLVVVEAAATLLEGVEAHLDTGPAALQLIVDATVDFCSLTGESLPWPVWACSEAAARAFISQSASRVPLVAVAMVMRRLEAALPALPTDTQLTDVPPSLLPKLPQHDDGEDEDESEGWMPLLYVIQRQEERARVPDTLRVDVCGAIEELMCALMLDGPAAARAVLGRDAVLAFARRFNDALRARREPFDVLERRLLVLLSLDGGLEAGMSGGLVATLMDRLRTLLLNHDFALTDALLDLDVRGGVLEPVWLLVTALGTGDALAMLGSDENGLSRACTEFGALLSGPRARFDDSYLLALRFFYALALSAPAAFAAVDARLHVSAHVAVAEEAGAPHDAARWIRRRLLALRAAMRVSALVELLVDDGDGPVAQSLDGALGSMRLLSSVSAVADAVRRVSARLLELCGDASAVVVIEGEDAGEHDGGRMSAGLATVCRVMELEEGLCADLLRAETQSRRSHRLAVVVAMAGDRHRIVPLSFAVQDAASPARVLVVERRRGFPENVPWFFGPLGLLLAFSGAGDESFFGLMHSLEFCFVHPDWAHHGVFVTKERVVPLRPRALMEQFIAELVALELPAVASAWAASGTLLRTVRVWLDTCFLGHLPQPLPLACAALPFLLGADYQAYLITAVLRHTQHVAARLDDASDAARDALLGFSAPDTSDDERAMHPAPCMASFELGDALPYMRALERRHRGRFTALLHTAMF